MKSFLRRKYLVHKELRQILRRKFALSPYLVRVYVKFLERIIQVTYRTKYEIQATRNRTSKRKINHERNHKTFPFQLANPR